jgi:hypothetical protein
VAHSKSGLPINGYLDYQTPLEVFESGIIQQQKVALKT